MVNRCFKQCYLIEESPHEIYKSLAGWVGTQWQIFLVELNSAAQWLPSFLIHTYSFIYFSKIAVCTEFISMQQNEKFSIFSALWFRDSGNDSVLNALTWEFSIILNKWEKKTFKKVKIRKCRAICVWMDLSNDYDVWTKFLCD